MGRHAASSNPPNVKPRPTDEEIQRQILSRVGQRVNFTYPGTEGSLGGVLKERIVIKGGIGASPDIPYWDVVDLIEFEGTAEPLCMRVGYYRYSGGRLNWGSQTTLTEPYQCGDNSSRRPRRSHGLPTYFSARPSNNEMKRTKPAMARTARSSPLISGSTDSRVAM